MSAHSFNAGLVWGTPVRPDLLGLHLEAYQKALPTLKILRLCHRFGSGPEAYITKLPIEVERAIEDVIIVEHIKRILSYNEWITSFMHFEGRCEPIDHVYDAYNDIFADVEGEKLAELCETCKKNGGCSDNCQKNCRSLIDEQINQMLYENVEMQLECCQEERKTWENLIDQGRDGNFAKLDDILRKYFGLEAYFATTRNTTESPDTWPSDDNHDWQYDVVLETTVCFLTLPKQMTAETTYLVREDEVMDGFINIQGSQSYIVQLPTISDKDQRMRQFQHALRVLQLEPYVHPSQLKA